LNNARQKTLTVAAIFEPVENIHISSWHYTARPRRNLMGDCSAATLTYLCGM
jgi:hypothetical protein